ncbi:MAG: LAGLIDADG family homing endonuclease [Promethearchaeota archaeon]|jgi:intein/homing endonuclease
MRIKNNTNNTLYIEDLDLHLPYKDGEGQTIDPDTLKKSKTLRGFIINGLLDVLEYDPNERIEASIIYLREKSSAVVESSAARDQAEKESVETTDLDVGSNSIEVRIHGIFLDGGGYAKVNRNLALKLDEAGLRVKVDAKRSQNQLRESELVDIQRLARTKLSKRHISIDSVIPSFAEYATGKYRILYTTVESYTVPKQFLECCQLYDEIWITSPWSMEILKKHVKKPIYHVPVGVDHELYCEYGPKFDFRPNIKDFVFISVFGWSYRKGYDVLLKAYFEEFDASDNVSLLIASRYQSGIARSHRNKIRDDINDIMKQFPNKDMPHVVRYSQMIPEAQMPQLYRSADCFVLPSRGEGSCCVTGTKITTSTGIKDIETILAGDYVLTHQGKFERVTNTMSRLIDEDVCSIYTAMNGSSPVTITKEHPVFVLKRKEVLKNGKKILEKFDPNNCEWIDADELATSDYVVHPLNFSELTRGSPNKGLRHLTTTNYLNLDNIIVENAMVYRNGRSFGKNRSIHPNCSPIPWRIPLTEDFLRFLGLYIAEGWCGHNAARNKGRISFTFHSEEFEYHKVVKRTMKEVFHQDTQVGDYQIDGRKYRHTIECSNTLCSELFNGLFGTGSHNKHVPDFSWQLSKRQRFALIRGIFEGDGCFYNDQSSPSLSLSSVSEQLIDEVMLLLRSVGINGCKQTKKNRGFLISIKGQQLNELNFIKNAAYESDKRRMTVSVKNKDHIFFPIKKIEKHRYTGMVYNLEVEHDTSYVANFAIHNCLTAPEASLCGLPIIMTNVSGQQMYLRPDNAFLIEMDNLTEMRTGQMHLHYWDGQKFPALTSPEVRKELREAMRYVTKHTNKAKLRNKKLQKLIKEQFTWNNTANAAIERLRQINKEIN